MYVSGRQANANGLCMHMTRDGQCQVIRRRLCGSFRIHTHHVFGARWAHKGPACTQATPAIIPAWPPSAHLPLPACQWSALHNRKH